MGPVEVLWHGDGVPPCEQTETCENSTFLILRMRAVKNQPALFLNTGQPNPPCYISLFLLMKTSCMDILVFIMYLAYGWDLPSKSLRQCLH